MKTTSTTTHRAVLGAALTALTWLAACGGEQAAAPAPVAPKAAAPAAAKPKPAADAGVPAAAEVARADYSYNPLGKRDPFRGPFTASAAPQPGEPGGSTDACQEPLCKFDMEELTLVAVVSGDANPMAMLEDRTGQGHVVRRNSRVGKNGGKVTAISRNCLTVTSYFTGTDGKAKPNKVETCVKVDDKMRDPLDLMKNKVD